MKVRAEALTLLVDFRNSQSSTCCRLGSIDRLRGSGRLGAKSPKGQPDHPATGLGHPATARCCPFLSTGFALYLVDRYAAAPSHFVWRSMQATLFRLPLNSHSQNSSNLQHDVVRRPSGQVEYVDSGFRIPEDRNAGAIRREVPKILNTAGRLGIEAGERTLPFRGSKAVKIRCL